MKKQTEQAVMVTTFNRRGLIHGHCKRSGRTSEYYSWQAMKDRCEKSWSASDNLRSTLERWTLLLPRYKFKQRRAA